MERKRSRSWVGWSAPRWAGHHVIRNGDGAMMKQIMRALLCLCLLLPLGAKAEEFSDVFVFGDSLSDTGNLAAFANFQVQLLALDPRVLCKNVRESDSEPIPLCQEVDDLRVGLCFAKTSDLNEDGVPDLIFEFPCDDLFFESSRVSNGPVAVEVGFGELQPSLHFLPGVLRPLELGTNYAVAGATARGPSLGDLNVQIAGFLVDHFPPPPDALYVVMIGGNDVIDAANALAELVIGSTPDETPGAIIDDAVAAIGDNINLLVGAGARKFLVVNSPNIGSLPAAEPGLGRLIATFVTIKFNEQLKERLEQIRAKQQQIGNPVEIKEFNLFRFFEGVRFVGRLSRVFKNIDDACFDSKAYRDNGRPVIFHRKCGFDKFDTFVFFDAIHPTRKVHAFVGDALFDVVD